MRPLIYRSVWISANTVGRLGRAFKARDWDAALEKRSDPCDPYLEDNTLARLGKLLPKLPNVDEIRDCGFWDWVRWTRRATPAR
ncbi:hypothetical protein JCM3770_001532 [Rhodotorula araucariae]